MQRIALNQKRTGFGRAVIKQKFQQPAALNIILLIMHASDLASYIYVYYKPSFYVDLLMYFPIFSDHS